MPFEFEKFRQYVEHCDLTEEQKRAVLQDLWSILESFVDEAWGLCPTQQFANDTEQNDSINSLNMIEYFNTNSANDNERHDALPRGKRKR